MLKHVLFLLSFCAAGIIYSQATLFTDDIESGGGIWSTTGDLVPNYWIFNSCAGNGASQAGANSMYITPGGAVPGCGATGTEQYNYNDAPATSVHSVVSYTNIDATCASSLQVNFDYRIDGNPGSDFGELVYSTDGGSTWITAGGELTPSAAWTNTTISLPGILDASIFDLGFQFTYDDATITGMPLAIDNITLTGTDLIAPSIVCPVLPVLAVDGSCTAIMDDFTKSMISLSDNCTDSIDIFVTQDIPEFTVLPGAPGFTQSLTLTATDEAGNSSQCTFDILIIDNINPNLFCPADTSVYVDNSCNGLIPDYSGEITVSDNCTAFGSLIINQTPLPGTVVNGAGITTSIDFYVEDESGNSVTCSFNATTVDNTLPTIVCPSDQDLYADNSCQALLADYSSLAVADDNCVPGSSLTITQSPPPSTLISSNTLITMTVTGGVPATPQQCSFTANLIDTVSPSIVCPPAVDLYVDGNCEVSIIDYTGLAIIADNCGGPYSIDQLPAPGTIETVENDVIIILTVTDAAGNTGQCQFSQPILDTIQPVITCPPTQTIDADLSCTGIVGDYIALASTVDNCTPSFTLVQSPLPGTVISSSTVITLTTEDDYANVGTCLFDLDIIDVTPPTVTCPPAVTVGTDAGCNATLADYTPSTNVTDNCSATFTYSQTPIAGSSIGLGVTTITITATDESGNSADCSFDVTVIDQISPTIVSCAPNQTINVDMNCEGAIGDYTSLLSATDNCTSGGSLVVTQSPIAGSTISTSTVVTLTVTDAAGNSSDCLFSVNIIDDTDPIVTCPSDQILPINSSCEYTVPDFSGLITGTDNCSALIDMTIIQSPAIGATESSITPVIITLFDEGGNSATCSFSIYPDDTEAPTITCPTPAPEDIGTNCDFVVPNYMSGSLVLDNCSNYTLTQNPQVGAIINPGLNDITITVTDAGGNTASCILVLEVTENTSPTITCPGNISTCDSVITYSDPTFNDNCFAYITQTDLSGLSSGSTFPIGITTIEYTVADSSGNSSTCTFDIEVLDYPSQAVILDDTIYVCDATSSLLSANAPTSGIGTWTLISGTGNFNNEMANVTGVNGLSYGENVFVWTVNSAMCGSTSDTVMIIASQEPLPAVIQADTIYGCNDPLISLSANAPIYGNGSWTTNEGAFIEYPDSLNTTVTPQNSGWQYFYWTVTSGGCPITIDSVAVFATLPPSINLSDTSICLENDLLTITGTSPIDQQVSGWYFISGFGDISDPSSDTTTVSDFDLGANWLVYGLDHPICGLVQDTVIIVANLCDGFNPILPTVITPDFDGSNDLFVIDHLEKVHENCHVVIFNRWGSVVFESFGYEEPWDGTYKEEPLPMGTYFYRIELNDPDGTVLRGDISIIR